MHAMRTAISLSRELFLEGERLAREMGILRRELYARALVDYIRRHDAAAITSRLNALYADRESRLDPILAASQNACLADEAW